MKELVETEKDLVMKTDLNLLIFKTKSICMSIHLNDYQEGNKVRNDDNEIFTVGAIGDDNKFTLIDDHGRILFEKDYGHIYPLNITDSVILYFGNTKTDWGKIIDHDPRYLYYSYVIKNVDLKSPCKLDYVHQIQNFYFELTGEKLHVPKDVIFG